MADKKKYNYGGQAVIEGVMMRGQKAAVTAVRRPSGGISMNIKPLHSIYTSRMRRTPMLRGVVVLIEAMVLGIKSLLYSANIAMEEEEEDISKKAIWGMIGSALILVVALFFIAPLFLTKLVNSYIPNSLIFHIIEGVIRLVIFLAYLKLISLLPDIKRVFSYHGAEHKTINAYEDGSSLEIEDVRKYSTAHVRCGTSFLFAVLIIAIVVFAFIGRQDIWLMLLSRVVLIPVIAAIGYEFTYFGARHCKNVLLRMILAPGLLLQSMTTDEPDNRQIEVAITALKKALEMDETKETVQSPSLEFSKPGPVSS
ncbi:DUF1385 domain-containing protein [Chloroflexota bacterium]